MHTGKKKQKQKIDNKKSTSHFQNKQEGWNPFQTRKESACQCRRHKRCVFNFWSGPAPGEGNGYIFQYSCLENFMDRGALWAIVHGSTKSQTRLSTHIDAHNQKSRQEPKNKTIKYKYTRHFQWFSQTVLKDTGLQCITLLSFALSLNPSSTN